MSLVRLFLAAALGIGLLVYFFARPPAISAGGIDFAAFYCGATTLSVGKDPYNYEPLHTCEHENRRWPGARDVVAAPLPPYALAILIPISRFPFAQASFLWFLLIIASSLVIIASIIELTHLPLMIVGPCITIAVLVQALPTGSLAPIVLALLCSAAVAVARKRWTAAAVLLGLACLEPHVALPALLAACILIPQMRLRVGAVLVLLSLVSVLSGGIALNVEYVAKALPAHAVSELGSVVQFSLSSMLYNLGLPSGPSIAIGGIQYLLFALAGIWLIYPVRQKAPALVVLVPMALAVVGGTYIHLSQIAAVLPLAFVVAAEGEKPFAWVGVALLTIPWNLLNAFAPSVLTVPRLTEVAAGTFAHRFLPGEFAYLANALVYLGMFCIFLGFLVSRRYAFLRE